MRRTRVILVTCIGLVIQILYIKRARGSSLPLDRTLSLHRNPNTYFTLHTFYLYPLYLHIVPVLVISIHVNKAFQLIQLGPLQLPLGPTFPPSRVEWLFCIDHYILLGINSTSFIPHTHCFTSYVQVTTHVKPDFTQDLSTSHSKVLHMWY